ncbi:hypothetical protein KIL84_009749 [Mauremys mutica]|uniref:Uncharacterized protein n=1 Tax=Mauremys mutica TaxID=74926 RepID=A0A9D4B6C4_9SAUR|nr:hypothetical protein KIL84_009749 [Mauremys mutica]
MSWLQFPLLGWLPGVRIHAFPCLEHLYECLCVNSPHQDVEQAYIYIYLNSTSKRHPVRSVPSPHHTQGLSIHLFTSAHTLISGLSNEGREMALAVCRERLHTWAKECGGGGVTPPLNTPLRETPSQKLPLVNIKGVCAGLAVV